MAFASEHGGVPAFFSVILCFFPYEKDLRVKELLAARHRRSRSLQQALGSP